MKRIIFFINIWIGICFSGTGQISKDVIVKQSDLKIIKTGEYDKIYYDNVFYTDITGQPELPVYIQSFVIPIDAQVTGVRINGISKQKLTGTYHIQPVQPPLPVSAKDNAGNFEQPDPTVYNSSMPYPGKQAEIISDDLYLGYRIITVRLYPVEYIPQAKELYICNFDFSIDYSMSAKQIKSNEFTTQTQSLYRYEQNKKNVKFQVENPQEVDNYDTKVQKVIEGKKVVYDFSTASEEKAGLHAQTVPIVPDYIIITNNALKPSFQTLADWKTKKGIFTVIATTEEINADYPGSDLQEKIKNYLINAYSNWGDGLYVLLGGDIDIIPSRFIKGGQDTLSSYPSDKYYSTPSSEVWSVYKKNVFEGNNSISRINILGRIPVSNAQEVNTYINKLVAYEKADNLGNLNYLKNNLYADAYLQYNSNGGLISFFHIYIKNHLSIYVPGTINKKFICDNADCTGDINRYTPNGSDCKNGNTNGDIELNRNNFLSCLNTGANLGIGKFHFVYHMDHSDVKTMGTSGKDKGENVNINNINNLNNGTSYQIFMSGGCKPANFAYDCIGKHYLTNPNGGGVAFIGNTDVGWASEHNQVGDFSNAIYSTSGYPSLRRYDIGSAYLNALDKTTKQNWRLHLLGDPEMQVWTNVPQTFQVLIQDTIIQAGSQTLTVDISGLTLPSGEKAFICLQKGTEVYEIDTSSTNGTYTIPFTAETTGTLNVTVTAHNYFPVEKTVQIIASTTPNPVIRSVKFVDNGTNNSSGNGNEQNDAGEIIRLQVELENNGTNTANNLTATLTSTSSYISILESTANFGSITSGNAVTGQFLYKINNDAPEILADNRNPVQFKLEIRDASNTLWTRTFNINVFASELRQRNKINISTTNNVVTFNIELQNIGQAPTTTLTATLKANNVISVSRSYPVIGRFETKTATNAFQFTIPSGYNATNTPLQLEVTNTYGKKWIFDFTLARPEIITGLDFSATETDIDLTWQSLPNVSGYNIYRCDVGANDTESGTYIKLNTEPLSFSFFSDKGLDMLTKYYYKVVAVSSSGMESNAERILTWTSYGSKYYFPVMPDPDLGRVFSPINIADMDMDGKKEIFAGTWSSHDTPYGGYLMGLNYQGIELFDIDNNATTISGFAKLKALLNGLPALADMKKEGKRRVIIPTRDLGNHSNNELYCFSVEDNDGDHKPDLIWSTPLNYPCVRGVVAANIDNSPDGSMEVIVTPEERLNPILIYSADGQLLRSITPGVNSNYGAPAVADLDGDGDLEIIKACGNGIYVWHHDGTDFIPDKQPIYSNSAYDFRNSVIVCDLKGDGQKVILTSAAINNVGIILAVKKDGSLLPGWDAASQSIARTNQQEIAVGDLENNGKLKVVAMGPGKVKVWNGDGSLFREILINDLNPDKMSPLLADVDGDEEAEIIFGSISHNNLHAYKASTGQKALGFPLGIGIEWTPAIADVDGDGKNELLVKGINMFKTNGRPDRIEWGSERYNSCNTGEYSKICEPTIIQANTIWNTSQNICGDIIVKSGTLTINNGCNITMDNTSSIIVMAGATLKIDNGNLLNTNVKVMPQGNLLQDNNGYIKIRNNAEFNIQLGATWTVITGAIE